MSSALYDPSPIQREFHLCQANEILFAGAAGPGKSLSLLMDPFQTQIIGEHEKYLKTGRRSSGWAIHFRREFPMLAQTLDRAHNMFPKIDPKVHWSGDSYTFTFSCGYKFQFAHLRDLLDYQNYDSNQYCVEVGTPIVMGDGSRLRADQVKVGDEVMTLEGPRKVTATVAPYDTQCVCADVYRGHAFVGRQVHPTTHPLLTSGQGLSSQSRQTSGTGSQSPRGAGTWIDYESLLCGRRESPAKRVSIVGEESDCAGSCDGRPGWRQLPSLSVPVLLHAPTLRRVRVYQHSPTGCEGPCRQLGSPECSHVVDGLPTPGSTEGQPRIDGCQQRDSLSQTASLTSCDASCGRTGQGIAQGSQVGCQLDRCCDDGRLHGQTDTFQGRSPSPDDVASRIRSDSTPDGQGGTQEGNPVHGGWSYRNFYTREWRLASEEVLDGTCRLTPVGVRKVCDFTVEGANHYISDCGLINVNSHLAFDELVQFLEEQYRRLTARVRSSDPDLQKSLRVVSATNPAPGWVRDYFVNPAPQGRKLITKIITLENGESIKRTRIFIPATLKDNPDPAFRLSYEAQLQDQPAHIRLALLNGDWYVLQGAFFAQEWDPRVHVVDRFEVPGGWFRFRSMDWGYKSPGVVLWWAVDTDGDLLCYREHTFKGLYDHELARRVQEIEQNAGEWDDEKDCSRLSGPADTQIWEERGISGPTIAEVMSDHGVWWTKADKRAVAGVQQFIRRLRDRHGEKGKPGIRFFRDCHQTIRTIPSIGTDPNNPELPQDGVDDHWWDAVRYAVMHRPVIPKSDHVPKQRVRDELEERRERKLKNRSGKYGYGGF